MLNFGSSQEEVKTGRTRVGCGIHHLKIDSIELVEYPNFKKCQVNMTCVKTLQGTPSAGLKGQLDLIWPTGRTDEEFNDRSQKFIKRLRHIFNKTAGTAKIDNINAWFDKLVVNNLEELTTKLSANFVGKELNLKFIAIKKNTKTGDAYFAEVPMYIYGIAECADVTTSSLEFDAETENMPKKNTSKVEDTSSADPLDDLPF